MLPTLQVVPAGPYLGFTLPELLDELDRLKAERKALNSSLIGSSVGGQTFQFSDADKQLMALNRRLQDLQAALSYLDPGRFPLPAPTDRAVVAL